MRSLQILFFFLTTLTGPEIGDTQQPPSKLDCPPSLNLHASLWIKRLMIQRPHMGQWQRAGPSSSIKLTLIAHFCSTAIWKLGLQNSEPKEEGCNRYYWYWFCFESWALSRKHSCLSVFMGDGFQDAHATSGLQMLKYLQVLYKKMHNTCKNLHTSSLCFKSLLNYST
jgi:hypothetical protein